MKNYFNTIIGNNGLWVDLKKSNLESLLEKAKELEKKYEWLQATEFYKKAVDLALEEKDSQKVAELQEQIGFCFFKAALQADTNDIFRDRMKLAEVVSFEIDLLHVDLWVYFHPGNGRFESFLVIPQVAGNHFEALDQRIYQEASADFFHLGPFQVSLDEVLNGCIYFLFFLQFQAQY